MPDRVATLSECSRVVLQIHGSTELNPDARQLEVIRNTRIIILEMASEILAACVAGTTAKCSRSVKEALCDFHTENNYTCQDKLVRDLMDLAATLSDLEAGRHRRTTKPLEDLQLFCVHMRHELRSRPA